MPDEIDWSLTTYAGNRLRQHREFLALPFREKLAIIEQMCIVAEHFASHRPSGDRPPRGTGNAEPPEQQ